MIEVKNIYKSFADNKVLKDVSATFDDGKINLIIGQSGSGKTVLLKSLVGLYRIDKGRVMYDDVVFNELSLKKQKELRQKMGMLFQGSALFDFLTVEQNVMFPLDMFSRMKPDEKRDRANECLKQVNLENANHLLPSEISGGMQKRVGIARAIVNNPQYLFCDEPTSGLDPRTAVIIDQLIAELTEQYQTTTIINTHDMNSVTQIGEKIIFIYKGNKWWEGNKEEVFNTSNTELNDFIFASNITQQAKNYQNLTENGSKGKGK
jgi:phospholipid/cholesterol/gamma-HCH transport system ATP-binding protein